MYAVVTRSTVSDFEQAGKFLQEEILPRIRQAPGFVTAYWVKLEGNNGTAMMLFESEDEARAWADQIKPPGFVTLTSKEVGEVLSHA